MRGWKERMCLAKRPINTQSQTKAVREHGPLLTTSGNLKQIPKVRDELIEGLRILNTCNRGGGGRRRSTWRFDGSWGSLLCHGGCCACGCRSSLCGGSGMFGSTGDRGWSGMVSSSRRRWRWSSFASGSSVVSGGGSVLYRSCWGVSIIVIWPGNREFSDTGRVEVLE